MGKGWFIAVVAIIGWATWRWQDTGPLPPVAWDARMVKALTTDLCDAQGKPAPSQTLAGTQRTLLYFSASWCPHCRDFTPKLVDFYRTHGGGKAFQLLFVSDDDSTGDMRAYMHDYDMPWRGVRYHSDSAKTLETAYPGSGIPRLVLLDGQGRVITDGFKHGRYIGWDAVLAAAADGH